LITAAIIRVPDSLAELDQWIVWRYEQRDGGKPTKVPYQINGSLASSTDPKTWCSFDEALKTWQQHSSHWSGIGFVFSATDPFFGIDLDDCLDAAGKLKPWAQPIIEKFSDTYAEISPRGQGIKIWAKGKLPGTGTAFPMGDGRVEIYDQARYFSVTGDHWAGQMLDVEEHQPDLDRLLALSPHGQKKVPFTVVGKIPKGSQHDTLVSIAGTMRARGCEQAEIGAALLEMNRSRLEEPAQEANIMRIVESICRYAPGDKRGIAGAERDLRGGADAAAISVTEANNDDDTLPDFPETTWRGAFADYRQAMSGTTEASDIAHFAALWAAAAVTLGRRVFMYAGERIFANVYLSLFGPTGDKKTTAQRRILNCGLLAPSISVIRNLGSTEGLADALKREDGSDTVALFFWEELTVLFARGRWTGSTILEFITETFDCPPEWGMKYRKDPISLVAPTPTILAGTTCEWFWKNARSDDFFGGLGNRFLYLTGPKKKPIPNPSEPGGAALQRVRDALAGLSKLHPVEARFDTVARRLWEQFYMSWEQGERTGLYAATVKRVHVYIRKLAMTYAALEGTLPVIGFEQLKAAIAVGVYAAECAKKLVDAQNAILRPEGELEQRFMKWIEEHDGAKKRDMQQTLSKITGGCETFNRVLLNLARADQIEIREKRVYVAR
jgi:hypothetical protein